MTSVHAPPIRRVLAPAAAPPRPRDRREIDRAITDALRRGDRATARAIYFEQVVPNRAYSHGEAERLAFMVGALDEGDSYLAERDDL